VTNDNSSPSNRPKQGSKFSDNTSKRKLSCSAISPTNQMRFHTNLKVMSMTPQKKHFHVLLNVPTRSTSPLARFLTQCACFVIATCSCCHKPIGMCNIVMEHGLGTQRFVPFLCSGFDLVSLSLGCTAILGPELRTRL